VLDFRSCKQAVDDDWKRPHALGITAVPTFVVNSARLVGAQPYKALERFLIKKGARKQQETG
jgi:predicted DsbA family dithiol-disulfide isomerase